MIKANDMVQWTNVIENRFMNLPSLPWQHEMSGNIHLVLPGLLAGRQTNFIILKFIVHLVFSLQVQHHYSCTNAICFFLFF